MSITRGSSCCTDPREMTKGSSGFQHCAWQVALAPRQVALRLGSQPLRNHCERTKCNDHRRSTSSSCAVETPVQLRHGRFRAIKCGCWPQRSKHMTCPPPLPSTTTRVRRPLSFRGVQNGSAIRPRRKNRFLRPHREPAQEARDGQFPREAEQNRTDPSTVTVV